MTTDSHAVDVAIVGAGVAGLATALALAKASSSVKTFKVTVFEKAHQLDEAGAGIQLQPNATRALYDLGLKESLDSIASIAEGLTFRTAAKGKVVARLNNASVDGFSHLTVHRADLIRCLYGAAVAAGVEVRLGDGVEAIELANSGVKLHSKAHQNRFFDVLIGADGIHSKVRSVLFGDDSPTFTGNVAWRGLVETARVGKAIEAGVIFAPGRHFVMYPVKGGELINFVAQEDGEDWTKESWTEQGDVRALRRGYANMGDDVSAILNATEHTYRWALFERKPLTSWSKGNAVILGDAAHAMLPNLAAGAAMAIEDGYLLAHCLSQLNTEEAFAHFYSMRIDRCTRAQKASAANARLFHLRSPFEQALKFGALRLGTRLYPNLLNRLTAWMREYDVTQVYQRQAPIRERRPGSA